MKKFILVVPTNDNEKFCISKYYINKLSKFDKPYNICDYNIKNVIFENICGILLTGGGDINPNIYFQEKHEKTADIDNKRDIFEIELLKEAFHRKIPTLCICRGIQVMNVAFGGDLQQHIEEHSQIEDRTVPTHYVDIEKNSLLSSIIKKERIKVNSIHHQAIKNVAKDFNIVASSGEVVEAIEYKDKSFFFLGIQWHPEALESEESYNIFSAFTKYSI